MSPSRASSASDTKQTILAATRRILREEGMEGVTMRRLAKELGMSAMAPYTYFPSRDVLLWTVSQEDIAGLLPFLKSRCDKGKDPVERLRNFLPAFAEWAMKHPDAYPWVLPSGFTGTMAMLDHVVELVCPADEDIRLDSWFLLKDLVREAIIPSDEQKIRKVALEVLILAAGLAFLAAPINAGFQGPEATLTDALDKGYFWDVVDTWIMGLRNRGLLRKRSEN